jgi:hypothetical protein
MPEDLLALMEMARNAGPLDRIEFRDRIAAFGAAAVPELVIWLDDPSLGSFAVRVLERIGRETETRQVVIDALMGARQRGPEPVRDDIDTVLLGLGKRVTRRTARPSVPTAPTGPATTGPASS